MKCKRCGAGEVTVRRQNYDYPTCGFSVTLCDVQVRMCSACGQRSATIPKMEELHRAVASAVTRKRARFTGAEVRFLRRILATSGAEFAKIIGVSAEIVSRWENDREVIGAANDRLLRLLIANHEPMSHYPINALQNIASESRPSLVRAHVARQGWSAETAETAETDAIFLHPQRSFGGRSRLM